jgi:hypothetical protein
MTHSHCLVSATTLVRCGVLAIALLGVSVRAQAQESVTISLPSAVSFPVDSVSTSTAGSPDPTTVQFSTAILLPGRALRVSVMADGSNFSGPGAATIPVTAVSWTVSNMSGGVGSSGTLSATSYRQVFQSSTLTLSGRFDVTWTMAAPGASILAGTYTQNLRWKIESVLP